MTDLQQLLRQLPAVDRIMGHPGLQDIHQLNGESLVKMWVRSAIATARDAARTEGAVPSVENVAAEVRRLARLHHGGRAVRVINATGVVLHTNLGRAPLSDAAVAALADTAGGYCALEFNVATGKRGRRGAFVEDAMSILAGAEAALVVNNNAAAVLLALTALARGRSVVVSRGELVEIGGRFRVPDVLERSGARMIEVGTTNRTRLEDYARAFDENEDVAAVLRVHQGNFRQTGFVGRPALRELAELCQSRGVTLIKDLGGGALVDLQPLGLKGEPVVSDCVEQGADITCFSSDKVLGGPQGGVIVGGAAHLDVIRRDPLARALRLGRLPLVALEATLDAYLKDDLAQVPTMEALHRHGAKVKERVAGWCEAIVAQHAPSAGMLSVVPMVGAVGGGALAEEPVPSFALVLRGLPVEASHSHLRGHCPPIVCRIHDEALWFDGRTVRPSEDGELVDGLVALFADSAGLAGGASTE